MYARLAGNSWVRSKIDEFLQTNLFVHVYLLIQTDHVYINTKHRV